LRMFIRTYCPPYALTRAIIQSARDKAKLEIFGSPPINAKYLFALREELSLRGHHVEVLTATRAEAIRRMQLVVIADEVQRRKDSGVPVLINDPAYVSETKLFLRQWMDTNKDFVTYHFGDDDDDHDCQFIVGILFAPGTSSHTVQYLQNVVQADAAHLQFGKYTFFSAYGSTANSNAAPIAFAILFGNEDTLGWTLFWKFVKKIVPCLDHEAVTVITDQDKGAKVAISNVLPQVGNFHCAWHRRTNIIKASTINDFTSM